MDFGQQIKDIRKKENLTQEQLALKLNVTRQAISNWENNKNLPDIGMLILMSNLFDVSLDYLIKGETDMNNMTEKVIKDGSETRRLRYNMRIVGIGAFLIFLGALLLFIKAHSVEYIDTEGILHENFYLVPMGVLSFLSGVLTIAIAGVRHLWQWWWHRS